MKSGAPWSIKGIDPQARDAAKKAAARAGMTLGEFFNQFLLEGELPGMEARRDRAPSSRPTASAADPDFNEGAIASALRDVTARLNRSEEHTISGMAEIRDSILEMSERVQGLEAAKYEAPAELRAEIDQIAESVAATRAQTEAAMDTTHGLMAHMSERLETSVEQSTEAVSTVNTAIEAMAERIDGLEAKIAAFRLEADNIAVPDISEAAEPAAELAAVAAIDALETIDEGEISETPVQETVSAPDPVEAEPAAEAFGTWISDTENIREEDFGYADDMTVGTFGDEQDVETSQFTSADDSAFETIELSEFGNEAEAGEPADNSGIAAVEVFESEQNVPGAEQADIPELPDALKLEAETPVAAEPESVPQSTIDELPAVEDTLADLYADDGDETTWGEPAQESFDVASAEPIAPTTDEQHLSIEQQIANVYGTDAAAAVGESSVEEPLADAGYDDEGVAAKASQENVPSIDATGINDEISTIDEEVAALFAEEPAAPAEELVPDAEAGEAFSAMEQEVNAAFQDATPSDDGAVEATETEDLGFDPFSEIDDEVAALFADEEDTGAADTDGPLGNDELSAAAAVQGEEVPVVEHAAEEKTSPEPVADDVDYLKQEIDNAFAMQDVDNDEDIASVVDMTAGAEGSAVKADDFDIDQYLDSHLDTVAQTADGSDETSGLGSASNAGSSVQDFLGQFDESTEAIGTPDAEPAVAAAPVEEVEPVSADVVADSNAEWDIPEGIKPDTGTAREKPRSAEEVISAIRKAAQIEAQRGAAAAAAGAAAGPIAATTEPESGGVRQSAGSREGMLKFGIIGGLALVVVFSLGYLLTQLWL